MILKKPYAFFIKMFKPIHLILSIMVAYLVYLSNNILIFLSEYMYSVENLVDKEQISSLISNFFNIIPITIIIFFFLLLGVMYKKKKPMLLYFVEIFIFIVILVINTYTVNFLGVISEKVVSIKMVKLIYDLMLINIILESISFVLLFVRGVGVDFKKFDFGADISKFEISESDKEEIEVSINIDFNERKRKRKEKIRNLKYLYVENKWVANIIIFGIVSVVALFVIFIVVKNTKVNKEGVYCNASSFVFKVNSTFKLNKDYRGNKITDNFLVVVETSMKSNYSNNSLYLNDFSLKIENIVFKPTKKYFDSLIDLGVSYNEQSLPLEYNDYVFVFEIPEKFISSKMYFSYNSEGSVVDVLLEPKEIINNEVSETKKISENIKFEGVLNGVEFKINSFDLNNKFLIEYNHCIKANDCVLSKEYLKPSIDENYDKVILKLNIDYSYSGDLAIKTFYNLLSKFGAVNYKKGDTWYSIYKFEEIASKKISTQKDIYIGLNSNIIGSEAIKVVFDVRGLRYEYILK